MYYNALPATCHKTICRMRYKDFFFADLRQYKSCICCGESAVLRFHKTLCYSQFLFVTGCGENKVISLKILSTIAKVFHIP
jgi:hypothetical protein